MKPLILPAVALALLGTLVAAGPLRAADDTTRRAQQALRDGGFYYGPIDGTPGDETTQATRRYQIRNGLAVSGQFNAETLRSLGINAPPPPSAPAGGASSSSSSANNSRGQRAESTPPPLSNPTPAPTTVPRTITSRPAAPTPTPAPRVSPPVGGSSRADPRVGGALPPGAQVPSVPLTGFFSRTPYEFAPPAVQADVLRRAQRSLGRGGFYEGPADGLPGRRTVEAIGEFQGAFRLPRSGRLDAPTLRVLRLLPDRGSNVPEPMTSTRRRGAPESDLEDEDDYAPGVRVRPGRPPGPEVYEGRILR